MVRMRTVAALLLAAWCFAGIGGCASNQNSETAREITAQRQSWWGQDRQPVIGPNQTPIMPPPAPGGVTPAGFTAPAGPPGTPPPSDVTAKKTEVTEDKKPFGIEDLAPSAINKKMRRMWTGDPNESIARQAFREGEALFRLKNYAEAKKKYKIAHDRWPDSALEEDAMFMIGESEFFSDRYAAADKAYDEMLKKYSNSEYLDQINRRRYAIGQYWQGVGAKNPQPFFVPNLTDKTRPLFDTSGRAVRCYERVMTSDARGALSDDAVMAVADAMFQKRYYDDADFRYKMLISDYPQSKHQFEAHQLSLRCKLLKYKTQGADYNGTVLDEADELIDQTFLQFPDKVAPHREELLTAKKEIHALKAERDWKTAEYYANTAHYGAARRYYQKVIQDYPNSSFARDARQRVQDYANLPDKPAHPLSWATRWVPGMSPETTPTAPSQPAPPEMAKQPPANPSR
jgi:outer membrane protein assembly factor BamD (BamD/ComL family)